MQLKTVVHRTMAYIKPDPKKVNARSYAYVEEQENYTLLEDVTPDQLLEEEVTTKANKQEVKFEKEKAVDVEPENEEQTDLKDTPFDDEPEF